MTRTFVCFLSVLLYLAGSADAQKKKPNAPKLQDAKNRETGKPVLDLEMHVHESGQRAPRRHGLVDGLRRPRELRLRYGELDSHEGPLG